jgi:hypothetical protein
MNDEATIQIRVIIPGGFLHEGIKYSEGDVSTEPHALGDYFIRAGWAVDTAGVVTHPVPDINTPIYLDVQDLVHPTDVPAIGV